MKSPVLLILAMISTLVGLSQEQTFDLSQIDHCGHVAFWQKTQDSLAKIVNVSGPFPRKKSLYRNISKRVAWFLFYEKYIDQVKFSQSKSNQPASTFLVNYRPYVLYNPAYYESITYEEFIHFLVLGHLIAHHQRSHQFHQSGFKKNRFLRHKFELEADFMAGLVLGRHGDFPLKVIEEKYKIVLRKENALNQDEHYQDYPSDIERINHTLVGYLFGKLDYYPFGTKIAIGEDRYITIRKESNGIYLGEVKKVKSTRNAFYAIQEEAYHLVKDGFGCFIYDAEQVNPFDYTHDFYIGKWKDGMKEGFGTYYFKNTNEYFGNYLSSTTPYPKGYRSRFFGHFVNKNHLFNTPYQLGSLFFKNGQYYKGRLINLTPSTDPVNPGKLLTFDDQQVYEGHWKKGAFHGLGIYTFTHFKHDSVQYIGTFNHGTREGKGKIVGIKDGTLIEEGCYENNKILASGNECKSMFD